MFRKRKRKKGSFGGFVLLLAAALLLYSLYYSNVPVMAEEYSLPFSNLPASFDGFRIAHLSDIHGSSYGENNQRLLSVLEEEAPRLIVITGDLVDEKHGPETVRTLLEQLTELAPVCYVTGNHEWAAGCVPELMELLDETGVTALRNEYISLTLGAERIVLAGVDDPNGYADQKRPETLLAEIRETEGEVFTILLNHRPDEPERHWDAGCDLVLAGHVHGGLVRLPKLGGLVAPGRVFLPPYTKGVYEAASGAKLLVSAGLAPVQSLPRLFNPLHVPIAVLRCS